MEGSEVIGHLPDRSLSSFLSGVGRLTTPRGGRPHNHEIARRLPRDQEDR
jgi:hypothetical protein